MAVWYNPRYDDLAVMEADSIFMLCNLDTRLWQALQVGKVAAPADV